MTPTWYMTRHNQYDKLSGSRLDEEAALCSFAQGRPSIYLDNKPAAAILPKLHLQYVGKKLPGESTKLVCQSDGWHLSGCKPERCFSLAKYASQHLSHLRQERCHPFVLPRISWVEGLQTHLQASDAPLFQSKRNSGLFSCALFGRVCASFWEHGIGANTRT